MRTWPSTSCAAAKDIASRSSSPSRCPRRTARHEPSAGRSNVAGSDVLKPPALAAALRRAGVREVDDSAGRRALYSSDASLYRVLPAGRRPPAARRRDRRRARGLPRSRGAADRAGRGHLDRRQRRRARRRPRHQPPPGPACSTIDPEARTATVEPGVVQARAAARPRAARPALRPRPVHAQPLHDRRDDRQQRLRLPGAGLRPDRRTTSSASTCVTGAGERLRLRPRGRAAGRRCSPSSAALVDGDLATIRTELGRFGRQVSGYSLEHLLPERGFDVARALVGSEGTLALVLGADRPPGRRRPPHRGLVVLGYPDDGRRRRRVPGLLPHRPAAVEGLDARIVDAVRDVPAPRPSRPAARGGLADRRARRRRAVAEVGRDRADACSPTPARWTASWSPTRPEAAAHLADPRGRRRARRPHQRRARRRTPAGRTPPSRPSSSAPTCASSRRC